MIDDLEPFESPKFLINSGKESLAQFESGCADFIKISTYDVIEHTDPKTGDKVVKLRFKHRIPGRLRTLAHTVLSDFRHSLDHAFCDGAILLGRDNAAGLYFPFGKDAGDLDRQIGDKCKRVDNGLLSYVRGLDPHYGANPLLCSLCSIAGPSKHQRVVRISLNSTNFTMHADANLYMRSPFIIGGNKWNDIRNELEFARIQLGGYINMNFTISLEIVLGVGEAPLGGPAPTVLGEFAGMCERIVLGIEAETSRILRERIV